MNVLATKSSTRQTLEAKGKPLGKAGVFIVFGFVGLVFATALIGVNAATSNNIIEISSASNQLSAVASYDDSGEASFDWSWFKIENAAGSNLNNGAVLAQACETADGASTGQMEFLESGSGSSVDIDTSSIDYLYCFMVSVSENGNARSTDYGGYIVKIIDITN